MAICRRLISMQARLADIADIRHQRRAPKRALKRTARYCVISLSFYIFFTDSADAHEMPAFFIDIFTPRHFTLMTAHADGH